MKLLAVCFLLFALPAWGATKFIDLSGTGTGAANGNDVSNQCAGVGDADCIGANLPAGSTAYLCNAATATVVNPVAGSAGNVTTYDCSCPGGTAGSISVSSGIAWNHNKAYTDVRNCTLTSAGITTSDRGVAIGANNTNVTNNTITGTGRSIELGTAAARNNITISGNTITGSELNPIVWSYACGSAFDLDDITITGNRLIDNGRAVSKPNGITLQYTANTAGCAMHRIAITDNYIEGQGGNAITVDHAIDAVTNEDITVTGNECGPGNDGCIAIHSFGSSTSNYGKNIIANNIIRGTLGDTGGINVFYNQYLDIYGNTCEDLSTDNIDGNCILIDHENDYVRVFRNWGDGMLGDAGANNSGVGLMILDSTNVHAFANIFRNVKNCFWFSGETTESGNLVENNSCYSATLYGARVQAATDLNSLTFRNNVLSGVATGISAEAGGNNQSFSYNLIDATTNYDLNSVFTTSNDVLVAPQFVGGANPTTPEGFQPFATSPLCGAGYPSPAKYDYTNKRLGNPPNIGAYGTCTAGRTSYSTRSTYVPR